MLVITQQPDDSFTIGDDIEVKILSVKGNQVRVGIDAPKSIPILRTDAKCRSPKQGENHACK